MKTNLVLILLGLVVIGISGCATAKATDTVASADVLLIEPSVVLTAPVYDPEATLFPIKRADGSVFEATAYGTLTVVATVTPPEYPYTIQQSVDLRDWKGGLELFNPKTVKETAESAQRVHIFQPLSSKDGSNYDKNFFRAYWEE